MAMMFGWLLFFAVAARNANDLSEELSHRRSVEVVSRSTCYVHVFLIGTPESTVPLLDAFSGVSERAEKPIAASEAEAEAGSHSHTSAVATTGVFTCGRCIAARVTSGNLTCGRRITARIAGGRFTCGHSTWFA